MRVRNRGGRPKKRRMERTKAKYNKGRPKKSSTEHASCSTEYRRAHEVASNYTKKTLMQAIKIIEKQEKNST
jgi:hypothetical protein